MKKTTLLTILVAGVLLMPVLSIAQTASGTVAVSATVDSSITMVLNSNAAGVALGGSSTAATLNFGNISAYGTIGTAGVTRSVLAPNFTVSTPFNVVVDKANGASAGWTLTAGLAAADATNIWALNGNVITNAAALLPGAPNAYGGTGTVYTLALTIPLTSSSGVISNTINLTATAN